MKRNPELDYFDYIHTLHFMKWTMDMSKEYLQVLNDE